MVCWEMVLWLAIAGVCLGLIVIALLRRFVWCGVDII